MQFDRTALLFLSTVLRFVRTVLLPSRTVLSLVRTVLHLVRTVLHLVRTQLLIMSLHLLILSIVLLHIRAFLPRSLREKALFFNHFQDILLIDQRLSPNGGRQSLIVPGPPSQIALPLPVVSLLPTSPPRWRRC